MLKAKLVALCVCPAVLTPPAIVAIHRPARHAVAHLLHRAADRLEAPAHRAAPVPAPVQYAEAPCPTLAAAGGGGVPLGGVGLAGLSPAIGAIPGEASSPGGFGFGFGGVGGYGGGGGGGYGGGGGGGGGSSSAPISPVVPVSMPPGSIGGLVPPASGSAMGTVPEPATWALLVTGFGAVGAGLRIKRPATA